MILSLFKSKPKLRDLIPEGFVDIHSHILPGIDDGAKNVEESFKMISEMKNLGFSKIIGTPHTYPGIYDNTNISIKNSHDKISKRIDLDIEISFASEYMLDVSLIKKANEKTLLTLPHNYVLLEMSFINKHNYLYDIIFQIQTNGYIPIIAHPERYLYLEKDFKSFIKLKNLGCKFQINLFSLTGYYGKKIIKISEKLLKNKLIDFVGSDIHNSIQLTEFSKKIMISEILEINKCIANNKIFKIKT